MICLKNSNNPVLNKGIIEEKGVEKVWLITLRINIYTRLHHFN